MKEEKMEARKSIRETFDAYQERTKNEPNPKLVKSAENVVKKTQQILEDGRNGRVPNGPRGARKMQYSKFDYSKVEMSKGDKIIYGIDEIGSILGLYGKDSEIYNAMAEGKVVSPMVEKSMKKNKEVGNEEIARREESLLARCLKREKEKGLEI